MRVVGAFRPGAAGLRCGQHLVCVMAPKLVRAATGRPRPTTAGAIVEHLLYPIEHLGTARDTLQLHVGRSHTSTGDGHPRDQPVIGAAPAAARSMVLAAAWSPAVRGPIRPEPVRGARVVGVVSLNLTSEGSAEMAVKIQFLALAGKSRRLAANRHYRAHQVLCCHRRRRKAPSGRSCLIVRP